jgi:hypothetical protein
MLLSGSVCVSADGSWGMEGCVCVAEYFLQCIDYSPEVCLHKPKTHKNVKYKDNRSYSPLQYSFGPNYNFQITV